MVKHHNTHTYSGQGGDVTWDKRLCIHIGECGRASNALFESGREPWCQPDLVAPPLTENVVERCPSGALMYHPKDPTHAEKAAAENTVVVSNHGPLYLRGELRIEGAADDMPGVKFRAALCRCGQSKNKPFCDNTHESVRFSDSGAVGEMGEGVAQSGGPLQVSRAPNGPLLVKGSFALIASSGRVAWRGAKAALCRCGASNNKPFCDGSHKAVGFVAE